MSEISTELIKEAVYKLCFDANTCLDNRVYSKILQAYNSDNQEELKLILKNAKTAYDSKLPLCQDTGQVIVFLEIGQNVKLKGEFIEDAINSAVANSYRDNYFRKSVVKNAIYDRSNTQTNTPAIIYTKYKEGSDIEVKVLIKGAGSENKSRLEMLLPTANEDEIINCCAKLILSAGKNACPPMFVGIGIGGTADKACLMSKEAFFCSSENELAQKIKDKVNLENKCVLDVKLLTSSTHIACMPVAITINCHSDRISSCTIKENNIIFNHQTPNFIEFNDILEDRKEISADDIDRIKSLKKGENILLTGRIYVARDMAHKRLKELMDRGDNLPFDIKNKIIFYAGPCPDRPDGTIGSIGPTTASRMDKYAVELYDKGIIATIGKGERNQQVQAAIKRNGAKYFSVTGGIAALLSNKVKKKEIIAFEDLGTEALYYIDVEKFPLKVELA